MLSCSFIEFMKKNPRRIKAAPVKAVTTEAWCITRRGRLKPIEACIYKDQLESEWAVYLGTNHCELRKCLITVLPKRK